MSSFSLERILPPLWLLRAFLLKLGLHSPSSFIHYSHFDLDDLPSLPTPFSWEPRLCSHTSLMIWLGSLNPKAKPDWCSLLCIGQSDWLCSLSPLSVPVTPPLPTTRDHWVSSHSQRGPNTSFTKVPKS